MIVANQTAPEREDQLQPQHRKACLAGSGCTSFGTLPACLAALAEGSVVPPLAAPPALRAPSHIGDTAQDSSVLSPLLPCQLENRRKYLQRGDAVQFL